jgi:putative FmdB family regulatory protein
MARYDYRCEKCGILEISHPMSMDALKECPECSSPIERLISPDAGAAIHYKGSGFFKTDYKKVDSNIKKYMPTDPSEKKIY